MKVGSGALISMPPHLYPKKGRVSSFPSSSVLRRPDTVPLLVTAGGKDLPASAVTDQLLGSALTRVAKGCRSASRST